MASITEKRLQELRDMYAELKVRCQLVDDKYSLVALEPQLDLPPSLNLEKLTFVPKSEEELRRLASESVAPYVLNKQRSLLQTYNSKLRQLSLQKSRLNADTAEDNKQSVDTLNADKAEILRKVIDHGMFFSTVANKYNDLAAQRFDERMQRISEANARSLADIEQQEADAEAQYNENIAALETERAAREQTALNDLREQEEKDKLAIDKYNNSVEEKEQRYQYSRAKAYESALSAQQKMAQQNAKTYAELGEQGYRRLIESEKYAVCVDAFATLTRSEGMLVLSFDNFLYSSLGSYYDAFYNWVNSTLIPD